jgi:hypothetical protein
LHWAGVPWRRCRPRLGLAHRLDQPERIYNESKLAKLAEEKLKEEFKSREKAMADMAGRLKVASEKLEKDAPTLSEADRVKRQRDVFELDKEYQRRQREFREDLSQRTNEERQAISEKATKIIKQMARSKASTSCCRTPSGPATASTSPTRCWRRSIKTKKKIGSPDGHSTRSIGRTLGRTVGGRCEPGSPGSRRWLTPAFRTSAFSAIANCAQALQSKAAALIVSAADDAFIAPATAARASSSRIRMCISPARRSISNR